MSHIEINGFDKFFYNPISTYTHTLYFSIQLCLNKSINLILLSWGFELNNNKKNLYIFFTFKSNKQKLSSLFKRHETQFICLIKFVR